jgi:dolichol-phosphate mannosyltransferase
VYPNSIGAIAHLIALGAAFRVFQLTFIYELTLAAFVAMVSNFYLIDRLTFEYAKRSGSRFIFGLIKFLMICGLGASINVLIASHLFELGLPWILSGLAGIIFVSVWNYSLSILFVWK